MNPLERVVYRSLFRVAKKFDRNPRAKTLVHRSLPDDTTTPSSLYYTNVLNSLLGKRILYLPPHSISFADILRKEARNEVPEDTKVKVETGLAFMRKLSSVWKQYKESVDSINSNSFTEIKKADDISGQMKGFISFSETNDIQPGHVLIAHPLLAGPLHRSVILVLENTEKGTYGLVINRPTSHTLHPAVTNLPAEMSVHFGSANVAFGGMVRRLQYLHTLPTCGGYEIPFCASPLFAGGMIKKVLNVVRNNPHMLSEFQFFVGCCCWRPGQLNDEIESGYWISVQTEPDKLVALLKSHSSAEGTSKSNDGLEEERMVDVYEYAIESLGKKYEIFTSIPHWIDCTKIEAL